MEEYSVLSFFSAVEGEELLLAQAEKSKAIQKINAKKEKRQKEAELFFFIKALQNNKNKGIYKKFIFYRHPLTC